MKIKISINEQKKRPHGLKRGSTGRRVERGGEGRRRAALFRRKTPCLDWEKED